MQLYSNIDNTLVDFDLSYKDEIIPIPEDTYLDIILNSKTNIPLTEKYYNKDLIYPSLEYSSFIITKIRQYIRGDYNFCIIDDSYFEELISALDYLLFVKIDHEQKQCLFSDEYKLVLFELLESRIMESLIDILDDEDLPLDYYSKCAVNKLGKGYLEVGNSAMNRFKHGFCKYLEVYPIENSKSLEENLNICIKKVFGKKESELDVYKYMKNNCVHIYIGNTELSTHSYYLKYHIENIEKFDKRRILKILKKHKVKFCLYNDMFYSSPLTSMNIRKENIHFNSPSNIFKNVLVQNDIIHDHLTYMSITSKNINNELLFTTYITARKKDEWVLGFILYKILNNKQEYRKSIYNIKYNFSHTCKCKGCLHTVNDYEHKIMELFYDLFEKYF